MSGCRDILIATSTGFIMLMPVMVQWSSSYVSFIVERPGSEKAFPSSRPNGTCWRNDNRVDMWGGSMLVVLGCRRIYVRWGSTLGPLVLRLHSIQKRGLDENRHFYLDNRSRYFVYHDHRSRSCVAFTPVLDPALTPFLITAVTQKHFKYVKNHS